MAAPNFLNRLQSRVPLRDLARIIRLFFNRYPRAACAVTASLLTANVLEGLSILTLLPLLTVVMGDLKSQSGTAASVIGALEGVGISVTLGPLLVFMVAAVWTKAFLNWFGMQYVGHTLIRVQNDLRADFIQSLLSARWQYFTNQPMGRLNNAITTEPDRAAHSISNAVTLLVALIQSAVYLAIAFFVSPVIALCAIVTGFGMTSLLGFYNRRIRRAGEDQTNYLNTMQSYFIDALQGIKPIKAMGLEKHIGPLLHREAEGLKGALQQQVQATMAARYAQEPVASLILAIGFFVSLTLIKISIVDVMVLAVLFWRTVQTLGGLQKIAQSMVASESALWSLLDATRQAKYELEQLSGQLPPGLARDMTFSHVRFAYADRLILKDLSLIIRANKITAVVGPSGTGKTTVADLVIGLYHPQAGEIAVDDMPLSQVDLSAWRERIGYVPQETTLFAGTVLTNVTLGDPALNEADAEAALRAAGAWDFVAALPQRINTPIGERGLHLSGGQRQRVALARALVRRPRLLILDEATTALDPATEEAICATLREISRGVTILAISHQPAILRVADYVYRLADGVAVNDNIRNLRINA